MSREMEQTRDQLEQMSQNGDATKTWFNKDANGNIVDMGQGNRPGAKYKDGDRVRAAVSLTASDGTQIPSGTLGTVKVVGGSGTDQDVKDRVEWDGIKIPDLEDISEKYLNSTTTSDEPKNATIPIPVVPDNQDLQSLQPSAVEMLTDQTVLAKVVVEDENSYARQAAVEKLTDQSVLAKVALTDKDKYVRQKAVAKVADQAVLAKVVLEDDELFVRNAATEGLLDMSLLAKVVLEDKAWEVRETAVRKLSDLALLAEVAVHDNDWNVREAAIGKLKDQRILADVAVADKDANVREAAVKKLTDVTLLAKIVAEDEAWQVRDAAKNRLDILSH
jgi:hypothetical protein